MKTLKNHTLIYDKDCPMCCAYTSAFIKTGVLDNQGREPYNQKLFPDNSNFDPHKAQNEIALINHETGKVQYGIDSMFTVIGHAAPILKPLFRFKPFKWIMKKVYSFISYNRKVIAPPPKDPIDIQCAPDVNLKYRWLYITFVTLLAGFISVIGVKLDGHKAYFSDLSLELGVLIIIAFRLALQALMVNASGHKNKLLDYLGNLMTVNLQLAILVGIGIICSHYYNPGSFLIIIGAVYANFIHVKRLKSLEMPAWLCLAWCLQWILIVGITARIWN